MNAMSSRRRRRLASLVPLGLAIAATACEPTHVVPEQPAWSDVEPILRAECTHCHGGSAAITGSAGGAVYRLDFFDVTADVCGEAASAIEAVGFAERWAASIASAITSTSPSIRPRMPPAPALSLADWQWQTVLRWTDHPVKGSVPSTNRLPTIQVDRDPGPADARLRLVITLDDPDGESAVGLVAVGGHQLKLDRPGRTFVELETAGWPSGELPVSAVVCDGWDRATYGLGKVTILHP
jgi:hypothetical protein